MDRGKSDSVSKEGEDKLASLKESRRKNGLCFKCGAKWGHNHKCPPQVPLHVLEEILDALEPEDDSDSKDFYEAGEEVIATVSQSQSLDNVRRRTMRICGNIAKLSVLILVDSGSVGSFISDKLANQLQLATMACEPVQLMAADGSPMVCDQRIPNLQWTAQGHTFVSSIGVLPLRCFDMILGADGLEEHSPMWVHWARKTMRFTSGGRRVTLQGLNPDWVQCSAATSKSVQGLLNRQAVTHCIQLRLDHPSCSQFPEEHSIAAIDDQNVLPPVAQLLQQYEDIFQTPSTLPPPRPFDHKIPLLHGAKPVNVRAYRYSPAQKDKIEKQLLEMLKSGIIKPSESPYAFPVLLVRKKDGSWRFCVDYRQLNAQTIKNKHPMPIVEELIDELAGVQWFSKLDFRAGYHQLCIHLDDTHKTAFKTHSGLYEFLVMAFGLTNASASFQGVMNLIFAHLLRKGVIIFMDDILVYSATLEEHMLLLQQVFQTIREHQFFLKRSKCFFAQKEVEYLGHCISRAGVATEPSKIAAVQ